MGFHHSGSRLPAMTITIMLINGIVFGLEIYRGGATNFDVLYGMGAMVPLAVQQGEGWRLMTANFLHYGIAHLVVNLLGLYAIGSWIERIWGKGWLAISYAVLGMATMGAVAAIALRQGEVNLMVVGASGAIMGLVGMMGAIFWRDWYQSRSRRAGWGLSLVGGMVIIQLISDQLSPQVSILSHLLGTIFGLAWGLVLDWGFKLRRPRF